MKEAETAAKIIAERWEVINKQGEELAAAKEEMERAAENLNAVNDSLSFEKFKEAKRRYEDAKDYYDMLQRAQTKAETATDSDYKLYRETAGGLSKAFGAEHDAAEKEALKPVRELLAILEKHEQAQRRYIEMDNDLKAVLHVANISAGPSAYDLIGNRRDLGGLLKEARKFKEEHDK